MSHKRVPERKAAIAIGSVAALGAAAFLLPNAMASQTDSSNNAAPKTFKAVDVADVTKQLASQLGNAFAGSYFNAGKQQLVVNVVGDISDAVNTVRTAGAVPNQVHNSPASLRAAAKTLRTKVTMPGTAWSVDPKTNEIRVSADSTVTGARWDTLLDTDPEATAVPPG